MFISLCIDKHQRLRRAFAQRMAITLAVVWMAAGASAQTTNSPPAQAPSLKQALDAAWQLSSSARAESNRRSELSAKEKAVGSWMSGEPVASIAHRTDRLNRNDGFREYEAEIEVPLWNPGVRGAAQADIAAQRVAFDGQFAFRDHVQNSTSAVFEARSLRVARA